MYMAHERRRYILRLLEQRKFIRSSALARELGVTDETIRTDLVTLHNLGLLQRVHGGARYTPPAAHTSVAAEQRLDSQLALRIIPHIPKHARVYLEPGIIATAILAHLGEHPCTIVTNAPDIVRTLAPPAMPQELICTGGTLIKKEKLFDSEEARAQLQIDIAILTPPAVGPTTIAYHSKLRASWARAALRAAGTTIIAGPASVLGAHAPHACAYAPQLLITEDNLPADFASIPTETVPFVSPESFTSDHSFDY